MGIFRAIVNKSFYESFYTAFIINMKSYQKKIAFFFFHKKFLKIFPKSMLLGHLLTFPFIIYYSFSLIFL